jgi:hypothetical protein
LTIDGMTYKHPDPPMPSLPDVEMDLDEEWACRIAYCNDGAASDEIISLSMRFRSQGFEDNSLTKSIWRLKFRFHTKSLLCLD